MVDVMQQFNYLMDPHGAVAYLGLQRFMSETRTSPPGIFLETAHPAKFLEVVEETVGKTIELPDALSQLRMRNKKSIPISNRIEDAKQELLKSRS
jgi:threonine synthase